MVIHFVCTMGGCACVCVCGYECMCVCVYVCMCACVCGGYVCVCMFVLCFGGVLMLRAAFLVKLSFVGKKYLEEL